MKASDIPLIDSRQDLDALCGAGQGPVVGLWATTLVNDNTALLLLLREALERRGVRTVFFLTCKEQLPGRSASCPRQAARGCSGWKIRMSSRKAPSPTCSSPIR